MSIVKISYRVVKILHGKRKKYIYKKWTNEIRSYSIGVRPDNETRLDSSNHRTYSSSELGAVLQSYTEKRVFFFSRIWAFHTIIQCSATHHGFRRPQLRRSLRRPRHWRLLADNHRRHGCRAGCTQADAHRPCRPEIEKFVFRSSVLRRDRSIV
jgi:hypothetical protein